MSDALDLHTQFKLEDGNLVVGRFQDCTPIAERCKALQNEGHHGTSEMRHAASIPFVMVEAYCHRLGITFQECMAGKEHIRAMLNDPALAHFRIWPGRV